VEISEYAHALVESDRLGTKLAPPEERLTDDAPHPPRLPLKPGRPPELAIVSASKARVPALPGMADPAQRVRILHGFANHELQAVELFAWALLAYPDAPDAFRRGLLRILGEEQTHCRLYCERLESYGAGFGDFPVSGYFWGKVGDLGTPLRFVCAMALTFESANLDHALDHASAADRHGDPETAAALRRVHDDEIGHVKFGWHWLGKLKAPEKTMVEAYLENVSWPLRPALARGPVFHRESREAAGLDESFLRLLEAAER
jgi:uncharacterized ferritin-like protein (DUF455 family)